MCLNFFSQVIPTVDMVILMEDTAILMEDMVTLMEDRGSQQRRKEKSLERSFTPTGMTTKMNTGMGTPAAVHPLSGSMQ